MNVLSSVEKDEAGVSDGLVEYECVMSVKWKGNEWDAKKSHYDKNIPVVLVSGSSMELSIFMLGIESKRWSHKWFKFHWESCWLFVKKRWFKKCRIQR
jgi:hypothetical protein